MNSCSLSIEFGSAHNVYYENNQRWRSKCRWGYLLVNVTRLKFILAGIFLEEPMKIFHSIHDIVQRTVRVCFQLFYFSFFIFLYFIFSIFIHDEIEKKYERRFINYNNCDIDTMVYRANVLVLPIPFSIEIVFAWHLPQRNHIHVNLKYNPSRRSLLHNFFETHRFLAHVYTRDLE